ncbi:DUF4142 domain-containing protein [Microvirga puerhi]|uniref:DUF4142 domain-containing protein n=1 Tax=Microvirga puerhi TaxID=2876078 RepID=A0ABS7VQ90_9HYPH|nr:DUF4142 domain-containing protein [Microvirga puerhi]MBZ6077690.1 DUF4142 domain-containing protein [Microvirga puerhi]
MSRRLVVAGLVAAIGLPALAQGVQQNQSIPYPVSPQNTESQPNQNIGQGAQQRQQRVQQGGAPQDTQTPSRQGQASAPSQMGEQQSQADAQYIQQTLAAGTVALQTSIFALSKAHDPHVKQFATFEVVEQNTLSDVLHSMAEPTTTASTTPGEQQAASTAPNLSQADANAMERMSKAQAGPAFDRDYIALQLKGHQDLLSIHDRYLQGGSGNRELTDVAKLEGDRIKEHIALLQDIEKELGR